MKNTSRIPIMVDTVRLDKRPNQREEIMNIRERCLCKDNFQKVSPEELLEILGSGKSFIPSKTEGRSNRKESMLETHLVILDVDNTELDENKKPIPLRKDDIRYLSIEKALGMSIVREEAFAVQKSIRYSEESERFKIVFLLQEPITNWKENEMLYKYLQKQIPYCDEVVSLSTRLFYGGKSDNEAVIKLGNEFDNSALTFEDVGEATVKANIILSDSMKGGAGDFAEMIKRGDSDEMKEWFSGTLFDTAKMTIPEIYERLLQTDMKELLRTKNRLFCCLFHDDSHPSGSIFKGNDSNWYYRCHSEACGVKGDFLSILKRIRKSKSRVEAFNWFIEKLDLYPEEYRLIIEQMQVGFDTLKSNEDGLHRAIRGQKLHEMEEIYKILLSSVYFSADKEGHAISVMSGSLLARKMEQWYGRTHEFDYAIGKWNKLLSFMTFLGMVEKLSDDELPATVTDYLKQIADRTKEKIGGNSHIMSEFEPKRVSVYRLCKLDASFFKCLRDEIIPTMNKFYFTYQCFSYNWVKLCFDATKAKKVFPQNERTAHSDQTGEVLEIASLILKRLNPLEVYVVTERELIKEVSGLLPNYSSVSVQNILKENRGYFIKLGYYLFRATKDNKTLLNLVGARSCMVYSVVSPDIEEPFREMVLDGTFTPMYQIRVVTQSDGRRVSQKGSPIKLN